MRVLHITPIYPSESNPGKGTFIKSQIDSLRGLVDIDILVLPGNRGITPYLLDIQVIRQKLKEDFDIIHVHFGHVSTLIKLIRKGNTAIVTSYLGSDILGAKTTSLLKGAKGKFFSGLNKKFSKLDNQTIVKTQEMADLLGQYSKNISVIPNGVDTQMFSIHDSLKAKKKLGLPTNKKTILFPADPKLKVKNFQLLKLALKGVDSTKYELVTFENGDIPHALVPTYLNASDLVICTSLHEGSPNIIKEAMACNRTIFSTDCGDVKWLLEGVSDGRILDSSPEQWTTAINELLNNNSINISNARASLIEKGLTIEKIAERILAIYVKAETQINGPK